MLNIRSYIRLLVVLSAATLLAACGGDESKGGSSKPKVQDKSAPAKVLGEDEGGGLRSFVGQPLRVEQDALVMKDANSDEFRFAIRQEDLAGVDPQHVASHVGFTDLAFKIYFRDEDGVMYATSSEEVGVEEMQ